MPGGITKPILIKLLYPSINAISLYFMHYNFVKTHKTLANPYPRTPAMAAGISDHIWSFGEIVKLLDKMSQNDTQNNSHKSNNS